MIVAFRVDASFLIGTGHVMRCLALADRLKKFNVTCIFLCREHVGSLFELIESKGHLILSLGHPVLPKNNLRENFNGTYKGWLGVDVLKDVADTKTKLKSLYVDWLVVDHYAIDSEWEGEIKSLCSKILVIDDLANREHDCDLLLDQNLGRSFFDYASLVPKECEVLAGPRYAILRPEFGELRQSSLIRRKNGALKRLLITMGGIDSSNKTGAVLGALSKAYFIDKNMIIDVVIGKNAPWRDKVIEQASTLPININVHAGTDEMAKLMHDADLAIGAAGSTAWERCCLGLPSAQIILAENQTHIAQSLEDAGAARTINEINLSLEIGDFFESIINDPSVLVSMSIRASQITNGVGVELVAEKIIKGC